MIKNTDKPFKRMFAVLDYVASSLRAVSTTDISEELKLPLNTTHRIVANLAAQGFLRCVEDVRQRVIGPVLDPETGFARRKVADRIVFMDHGAIVEEDTPETFFKSPKTDRAREFLSQIVH